MHLEDYGDKFIFSCLIWDYDPVNRIYTAKRLSHQGHYKARNKEELFAMMTKLGIFGNRSSVRVYYKNHGKTLASFYWGRYSLKYENLFKYIIFPLQFKIMVTYLNFKAKK